MKLIYFHVTLILIWGTSCSNHNQLYQQIVEIDRDWIINDANQYLTEDVVAITDETCKRSEGGIHDFYSEGDYWWPNPDAPEGPYIRRDGLTNPENFTAHRKAMRRMSIHVATLTAAFKITGDTRYSQHAVKHLLAWFVDETTKMNPNMKFAQAIKGRVPGRGVGLIDGIHLVEPARAITYLFNSGALTSVEFSLIQNWFSEFLMFMTNHEYGIDERDRKNNHGTCWVMQASEFSRLTGDDEIMNYCRDRFKTVLLPNQLAKDGSFPMELDRTKPYGYSLFNIDIMTAVCHILSTPEDNLWSFTLPDGQGMSTAMAFIYPYIKDKNIWPYKQDVMYWDQWPVRHPALLFSGLAYENSDYLELWKTLKSLPESDEGLRNFPIRQPLLWVE